ncbi:xylose isomerase-like TIM barrel [mine drainage metagenome]|uniref:Xylose isomerase-like TIM barrel n=1 Tax=mine drainage metagenome TaxID=410659 RepID=A0A1J5RPD4_9ZZZZ
MRLAVSTLALPAADAAALLPRLPALGVEGLELAAPGLDAAGADRWRRRAGAAGLTIVGLHDGAGAAGGDPLAGTAARRRALTRLTRLSALCRDIGGKTLIFRWPVHAGAPLLAGAESWRRCRAFLEELLAAIEAHGTLLCLAPAGPGGPSAHDCYLLANALDHPAFGLHLSAAGLAAGGEMGHATFAALRGRLDHVHVDEPGGAEAGSGGRVDHADLRRHLAAISYGHWLTLVQRPPAGGNATAALERGLRFVAGRYLPVDRR